MSTLQKFGHVVARCYHRFDINFQGVNNHSETKSHATNNNQDQAHTMIASSANINNDEWFFDTGATHHLSQTTSLDHLQSYNGNDKVIIRNGTQLSILHTDNKIFQSPSKVFQLKRVLHAPHLATSLVSVSQFYADNNTFVEFHHWFFLVKEQVTKKVLLKGHLERGLYKFSTSFSSSTDCLFSSFNNSSSSNSTTELWHSRLGHPAEDILKHAFNNCNIPYQCNKLQICGACQYAKSHKLPFPLSMSRASHPLALVHADIWGPTPTPSTSGARFFLLLIDDFSRFSWIYPLHTKDQALPMFVNFHTSVEKQLDFKIKSLQSNNGGEFKAFSSYLAAHGIEHGFSYP